MTDSEGGLDLTRLDSLTEDEQSKFDDFYARHKGTSLPGHEFWIRHDVGALKRYRSYAIEMNHPAGRAHPQVAVLCWLHFYAVIGFEEGIAYQIHNARQRGGSSDTDILATLQAAFLHSGPLGTRYVAAVADEALARPLSSSPVAWPTGWSADPATFQSGIDHAAPGLTPLEREAVLSWYERVHGEVPGWVSFLARHNPDALKSYRMRFEHAAAAGLPDQMFALLLLQWEASRGSAEGLRDACALARGVGVSRPYAVDAITRAMVYAGPAAATAVARHAGDVIDQMAD